MRKNNLPIIIFIIVLILTLFSIYSSFHINDYTVTVSGKERECDPDGNKLVCYYVVYGEDGSIFSNRDSILYWKFDSGSVQARFLTGHRYNVRAVGWRVAFLSMKPNIISSTEIK